MQNQYWSYRVHKNWDCIPDGDMLDSSLLCYGKPKSGKTNIGNCFFEQAIHQSRSVILFAENPNEYNLCLSLAEDNGYSVSFIDLQDDFGDEDDRLAYASSLAEEILEVPTVYVFTTKDFKAQSQHTILNDILDALCDEENEISPVRISVILDGLCGNLFLSYEQLTSMKMIFCLILPSEFMSGYWRRQMFIQASKQLQTKHSTWFTMKLNIIAGEYGYTLITAEDVDILFNEEAEDPDLSQQVIDLFYATALMPIHTICCTKVTGIRPMEQKEFIGLLCGMRKEAKIGGAFYIAEEAEGGTRVTYNNLGNIHEIPIEDNIEDTAYQDYSKDYIKKKMWIVLVDGQPCLYYSGNSFLPVSFYNRKEALCWILNFIQKQARHNISLKMETEAKSNELNVTVTVKDTVTEESTEYRLEYIDETNLEQFRMAYLLQLLYDEEVEEWIASGDSYGFLKPSEYEVCSLRYRRYEEWKQYMAKQQEAYEDELTAPEDPAVAAAALESYIEEHRWKPQDWSAELKDNAVEITPAPHITLPEKGVLFLGGHQNMVKKLRQLHPTWDYLTDDYLRNWNSQNTHIIFYWTAHSSHTMMQYVNSRISDDTVFLYVTATNLERLEKEMLTAYEDYLTRTGKLETAATTGV